MLFFVEFEASADLKNELLAKHSNRQVMNRGGYFFALSDKARVGEGAKSLEMRIKH